jgi:hypothetical protein
MKGNVKKYQVYQTCGTQGTETFPRDGGQLQHGIVSPIAVLLLASDADENIFT